LVLTGMGHGWNVGRAVISRARRQACWLRTRPAAPCGECPAASGQRGIGAQRCCPSNAIAAENPPAGQPGRKRKRASFGNRWLSHQNRPAWTTAICVNWSSGLSQKRARPPHAITSSRRASPGCANQGMSRLDELVGHLKARKIPA